MTVTNYAYAIFSGLSYALCFPKFNLGLICSWLWPIVLLEALDKAKNRRQAYGLTFLFSFAANAIILYWIPITIWTWSHSILATIFGYLTLVSYLSFITGLFGPLAKLFFLHSPHPNPLPRGEGIKFISLAPLGGEGRVRGIIILPSIWVTLEYLRSASFSLLGGFPWCLAGYALTNQIYLAQLAEIGGVSLLSFLVVFTATGFWLGLKNKKILYPGLSALAVLLAFGWGAYRYHSLKPGLKPVFKVAILQGNIYQYEKWDESKAERILQTYSNLAAQAYQEGADLIIWPETAYPKIIPIAGLESLHQLNINPPQKNSTNVFVPSFPPATAGKLQRESRPQRKLDPRFRGGDKIKNNVFNLIGAVTLDNQKLKNSGLLFKGDSFLASYSKVHLVPFGEYVPLRHFLKGFVQVLNELGDISPGQTLEPLKGPLKLGITICYESIFPELTRQLQANSAQALVNLTNDGWYLDTAAPYQHFLMNRLRAIETRLPLMRAANTGISAIINPLGEITRQSILNETAMIVGPVEIASQALPKLFFYGQKLFPWLCLVVVFALSLIIKWKRVRKGDI